MASDTNVQLFHRLHEDYVTPALWQFLVSKCELAARTGVHLFATINKEGTQVGVFDAENHEGAPHIMFELPEPAVPLMNKATWGLISANIKVFDDEVDEVFPLIGFVSERRRLCANLVQTMLVP